MSQYYAGVAIIIIGRNASLSSIAFSGKILRAYPQFRLETGVRNGNLLPVCNGALSPPY
jgi:hypothetical protein